MRRALRTVPYEGEVAPPTPRSRRCSQPCSTGRPPDATIVVLTGDHGESLGEHGEATHGIFAYEATLHVPLIVRCAGLLARGRAATIQARHVDIAPTSSTCSRFAPPPDLDGHSLRTAGRADAD